MLKTTKNTRSIVKPKKTKTKVCGNNIVSDGKIINQINSIKVKNQAKTTKSKILIRSKNYDFPPNSSNIKAEPGFLIFESRLAFIKLRKIFIKALIFYYFDPKCHIKIEINISKYVIGGI